MAYTTIDNSESAFLTFKYTGTGTTGSTLARTFDGSVNLKPGLFYQMRLESDGHATNIMECEYLGAGVHWLSTSGDAKGSSFSGGTKENLESFDTNGFTHATTNQGSYYHNQDGDEYIVWAWAETAFTQLRGLVLLIGLAHQQMELLVMGLEQDQKPVGCTQYK